MNRLNVYDHNKKARIFIVEDHPIFCDGLTQLINKEKDMMVCGVSENADKAYKLLEKTRPDLAIVDIKLQNSSGIILINEIQKRLKDIYILVLSMHDESIFADRVFKAGARGFISKHETSESVIKAIRYVLSGSIYMNGDIADTYLERLFNNKKSDITPVETLSRKEFEIFNLIGYGNSNSAIAEMLTMNTRTIMTYRDRIKEKLNLKTSSELVWYAMYWVQLDSYERKHFHRG